MKSKQDFRKTAKVATSYSDELRRGTRLKPVPKEKNIKRSMYELVDDFDELDEFDEEQFDNDELFDDDAYDEDEEDEEDDF